MNRATYNITDDRLKAWFDARLSPEDYAAAKAAGFVWWPGSKCLTCVWRPTAEDFLGRMALEIEDTAEADDVAARVERYSKYAANAEQAGDHAAERLESGAANTARRQRLAEGVAAREFSAAAHWQRRIAGAIRHAQQGEDAGAICRRIETLETDLRRHERAQQVNESITDGSRVWVGAMGRGQGWYVERAALPALLEHEKRWTAHIGHRLEYERARLAATGDPRALVAANQIVIEKGGAVRLNRRRVKHDGWYFITRLNPSSVEVYSPHEEEWRGHWIKIPRDEILEVATAAQVQAGTPATDQPPAAKPSSQPKGTAKGRDGNTPEKFGAFGASDGFFDKLATARWYLILKVNRTTVEYLTKQQVMRGDKTTYWQFYIKKTEIRGLSFLKTPQQVKAEHPDLLADWAKVEEIKARQAAAKATTTEAAPV